MITFLAGNAFANNNFFKLVDYDFNTILKSYVKQDFLSRSNYIVLLPKQAPTDLENTDPYSYFKQDALEGIRNGNIKIIFDSSCEGSHINFPYYQFFTMHAEKRKLPPHFYYVTGDAYEKIIYKNNNIYHINYNDSIMNQRLGRDSIVSNTPEKLFACVSRKPRAWRSKFIYTIFGSSISRDDYICGHPRVESLSDFYEPHALTNSPEIVEFFRKHSPMIASSIPTTDPFSLLNDVYDKICFDLSLETYQEGLHEYVTEKTFKAMYYKLPVIIWGTPGINTTALKRLGFKTYEDWFDLSFDDEPDTDLRLKKLINEVERVSLKLKAMSLQDRIAWQRTNLNVLDHNFGCLINNLESNRTEAQRLINDLT